MRASIGAEVDTRWEDPAENEADADTSMDGAQAELAALEARELELRRKRTGPDLTEAERVRIDADADHLLQLHLQKRRKIEADLEEASRRA